MTDHKHPGTIAPLPDIENLRVAVIGAGYVGLPVAIAFGHSVPTVAFDVNTQRIDALRSGHDSTHEIETEQFATATQLSFSSASNDIADQNFFIVTVPTPIDAFKRPDTSFLEQASETLGKVLKRGDVVVYESTVYPGATEDLCVPLLEKTSGLRFNQDFFVGYSPERINPGDKSHRLADIVKVTSGSTAEAADLVDKAYNLIITAGTHRASSIKVAEAAKVIENIQRDVNIALVNDFALLFRKLEIDTEEVLSAAGTKWNFLPFRPGLVGGHCIGVDPYYLTHKAQEAGHHPEMILAGRRVNDSMGDYAGSLALDALIAGGTNPKGARLLMLGLTFKENCPDIRNTLVARAIDYLSARGVEVDVHDPWADPAETLDELGIELVTNPSLSTYDAVVLAVAHTQFIDQTASGIRQHLKPGGTLIDLKWAFSQTDVDARL